MDLILWQLNKLFMVKAPIDKRPLFLVPEFCFSLPFCLPNFILSYSTWIIISLLSVFYPHSVHCISSSFVISFVLIPHNSLAFFFHPTNHQLRHGKIARSEIHFSSTCLSLPLSSWIPGIHHHFLALFTWSFLHCFLFSPLICFRGCPECHPYPWFLLTHNQPSKAWF